MEPPPAPPLSAAPPPHFSYPDSLDSSPRSRNSWDDTTHTSKLRLMCSYGGHIMPRPHDKSLCYIGGNTRIVVIDRHTTLSEFIDRVSKYLKQEKFIIKYQLPNEDLDSLISVTYDEDLENMIDEYDRLVSTKNKPSRLRIFIFPLKPESVSSVSGSLIVNSTNFDDFFLNALNSSVVTSSALSDSLLSFDDETVFPSNAKGVVNSSTVPESFLSEMMSSSSGSASSSPATVTLPVRAQGEDCKVGVEDQLVQMSSGVSSIPDAGGFVGLVATAPVSFAPVIGDQKHSDYVVTQKQNCSFDLLSPDSVSSDGSITNQLSHQKTTMYQDPMLQISRSSSNPVESKLTDSNTTTRIVQMQDYGYILQQQQQQQQFIPAAGTQYIQNRPTPSYYPIYPPNQPHFHPQYNPSAMYYVPAKQAQMYNEPQMFNDATSKPELGSVPYRTTSTGAQQYVGFSQMNLSGNVVNFGEPMQAHLYYNRVLDHSRQPKEQNVNHHQHPVRTTSQP